MRATRSNETLQCLPGLLSQPAALFPVTVAISNNGVPFRPTFSPQLCCSFSGVFSFDLSVWSELYKYSRGLSPIFRVANHPHQEPAADRGDGVSGCGVKIPCLDSPLRHLWFRKWFIWTRTDREDIRYREQKLARCRELLGMPAPEPATSEASTDYSERYEELTGSSLWECPVCSPRSHACDRGLAAKPAQASNADQGYLIMQKTALGSSFRVPHQLGPTK